MTQQSGRKVIISKLQLSCLMYLPLGWYLLSAPQWQLLSDWVAQFGFWCLPRWIQFGFSITSCYPRKPQGPIGHWRPPHESLYFLQTRLRGRGGHSPSSTQTLQTIQRVGEKGGERSHGASPPALSPINQTFPLRLCCSLLWLPQSSLFSLSNTPHWWAQLCCMLPVAVTKSNVLATQKKITSVWEMMQIFLMQLCRGQPCSQDQTRIELPIEWWPRPVGTAQIWSEIATARRKYNQNCGLDAQAVSSANKKGNKL